MSVYRFRSSLVYVEAKGEFERKVLPDLKGIVSPERLFNPLTSARSTSDISRRRRFPRPLLRKACESLWGLRPRAGWPKTWPD